MQKPSKQNTHTKYFKPKRYVPRYIECCFCFCYNVFVVLRSWEPNASFICHNHYLRFEQGALTLVSRVTLRLNTEDIIKLLKVVFNLLMISFKFLWHSVYLFLCVTLKLSVLFSYSLSFSLSRSIYSVFRICPVSFKQNNFITISVGVPIVFTISALTWNILQLGIVIQVPGDLVTTS